MKLSDLKPNEQNPRTITDAKKAMLKKALLKFGDLSGIVYNRKTKQLVGGHQRREAFDPDSAVTITKKYSKPTKTGTVAEGFIAFGNDHFTYREVYWDAITEKAANIAANKSAGEWDLPQLGEWIKELNSFDVDFDLDLTMFDPEEINDMLGIEVQGYIRTNVETGIDEDEIPKVKNPISKLGDIYLLGNHRLRCGDSTNARDLALLMHGEKADITFTSPPYNLGDNAKLRGYNGDGDDTVYNEKSDHKSQEEYLGFLKQWTAMALTSSKYVFCNIQLLAGNKLAIPQYWMALKNNLVDLMVWDKEHAQPSAAARVLNSVWEFIFILSIEDKPKRSIKTGKEFRGTIDNIFRFNPRCGPKDISSDTHGAVFPVAFAQHFVENFSTESVLDLFGGSGSTLIACEKTNRKCFMMEIDPHYCDVIVARWEKYTGLKSKLIRADNSVVQRKRRDGTKSESTQKSKAL